MGDDSVDKAIAAIKASGGVPDGQGGFAYIIEDYYFRIRGRRVKLTIVEYGNVGLYGPTNLVRKLAAQIAP